jgi:hypothetical protein
MFVMPPREWNSLVPRLSVRGDQAHGAQTSRCVVTAAVAPHGCLEVRVLQVQLGCQVSWLQVAYSDRCTSAGVTPDDVKARVSGGSSQ